MTTNTRAPAPAPARPAVPRPRHTPARAASVFLSTHPRTRLALLLSAPLFWLGVVQYQMFSAYEASPAWYASQSARNSQAASFDGASPKYAVAAAFDSGLAIQSSHAYAQFGLFASDAIIHVSDQPVAPSSGSTTAVGALSLSSTFWMTCHVVPTTESVVSKAEISFR